MSNPVVELIGISKSYPGVAALRGVDLRLLPGRIHALVGENGAGKSTLLGILDGLVAPDEGELRIGGVPTVLADPRAALAAGIGMIHQEVDLFADLSVEENIARLSGLPTGLLGWVKWSAVTEGAQDALAAVGSPVAADDRAAGLTPAQRQLVEIAAGVSHAVRVLILDEPTSSLSAAEVDRLFGHLRRLREQGTAVVYVSHRLDEVFALADDVTVLRDGQRVWTGPATDTTPGQLIRHMIGRDLPPSRPSGGATPGPVRLSCRGMTTTDDSCRDVHLEVRGGEVLGLYGLIGAGRSEWAQALFGLRPLASGEVVVDGVTVRPRSAGQMAGRGLAYVPEDRLRQGLCRGLSVRANAVLALLRRLATLGWLPPRREKTAAQSILARLDVRLASADQPIGTLSGGNQQKVVVGRWLARDPAVLILDEPTRGVDVGAREEIYALIRGVAAEGRAVVLISSDLPEVLQLADRIGVFRSGRLVAELPAGVSPDEVAAAALPRAGAEEVVTASRDSRLRKWAALPDGLGLAGFVVAMFVALHFFTGRFLEPATLRGLAVDASLLSFCALAAALVLLAGGLDISLGALMALSAGVAGQLWEQGYPLPLVLLIAGGVGAAGGALNAGLSLAGGVHPIVVTLGTMSVYRGLALRWLGQDVQIPLAARGWAMEDFLGVPLIGWLGLAVAALVGVFLKGFVAGRDLIALGSNPRAAVRVGIRPGHVWLTAFALQGLLVGLAGVLYLARSGSLQPTSHEERTLQAIAAAVVGGVAITGGRGSVVGVLVGCVLLVSLAPACRFLGVSEYWEQTLVGGVLLVAVAIDALSRRRAA